MKKVILLQAVAAVLVAPTCLYAEDVKLVQNEPTYSTFMALPEEVSRGQDMVLDIVRSADGSVLSVDVDIKANDGMLAKSERAIICIPGIGCPERPGGVGGTLSMPSTMLVQVIPNPAVDDNTGLSIGITDFTNGQFKMIPLPDFTVDGQGGATLVTK